MNRQKHTKQQAKNPRYAINGKTISYANLSNCIYMDELAFVPNAEEFYESVYPVISSSKNTKVIITSTPKGMNFFYKLWNEAEKGKNDYVAYDVKWYEHPDRDEQWYETETKNMAKKSVDQEINCVSGDSKVHIDGITMSIQDVFKLMDGKSIEIDGVEYKFLDKKL